MSGRTVDLRVLQYGVTRNRLREVLTEAEGWDIVHVSGHGQPGELLLETEEGDQDRIVGEQFADLLHVARERLKLVSVSACSSAALTAKQQLRLLNIPVPAATVDEAAGHDPRRSSAGTVADDLARRLDCAVLAMRYPVTDDFAVSLGERVYRLIVGNGQALPQALGIALPELVADAPTPSCPALSVATPTLFGDRAVGLALSAPPRPGRSPMRPGSSSWPASRNHRTGSWAGWP